jgi:hypothetical protein
MLYCSNLLPQYHLHNEKSITEIELLQLSIGGLELH